MIYFLYVTKTTGIEHVGKNPQVVKSEVQVAFNSACDWCTANKMTIMLWFHLART